MATVGGRGPGSERGTHGGRAPGPAPGADGERGPSATRRETGERGLARSLAERCAAGDRAALARAISMVENRRPGFRELLARVAEPGRRARRTGITGPPGAGKSTLVAALARRHREAGERVAIIAVDPTSPFSGGAVLGDRVRMAPLRPDPGVFIRSMATRGAEGGLAEAVHDVADLMEGSGFDHVLIETVGVGQTELDVAAAADTVVVVLTPESGDEVQAMKAGLTEVADVFVVNKADRGGARALVSQLRDAVALGRRRGGRGRPPDLAGPSPGAASGAAVEAVAEDGGGPGWEPPVLAAVATRGEGIGAVADAIEDHGRGEGAGELTARRVARARARVRAGLRAAFERRLTRLAGDGGFAEAARAVAGGERTVYDAVERLLADGGILSGTPARPAKPRGDEQP